MSATCSRPVGLGTGFARYRERFSIKDVAFLAAGSTSSVFSCLTHEGRPAVLKISDAPTRLSREICGLRVWAPHHCTPTLLDFDENEHAVLLERLDALPNADLVAPIGCLLRTLHSVPLHSAQGLAALDAVVDARLACCRADAAVVRDPRLAHLVTEATRTAERLLASAPPESQALLHGDFYPANLMARGPTAVAIDPNPCTGDRSFDAATWALDYNRAQNAPLRAEQLAVRCGLDIDRVLDWMRIISAVARVSDGALV